MLGTDRPINKFQFCFCRVGFEATVGASTTSHPASTSQMNVRLNINIYLNYYNIIIYLFSHSNQNIPLSTPSSHARNKFKNNWKLFLNVCDFCYYIVVSRAYPASKITGVAATPPPLALTHDVEKQSLSYVKRSGLATSNFGLSIISAPATIGQRPELSSASSILRAAQQQQSATVNGFLGYRAQKVPTRTVRGNSSGVIDL